MKVIVKQEIIVKPAGTARLKLIPGYYCGKSWGFSIQIENWLVKEEQHGSDGYSAGGVIDFKDIDRLYKISKEYRLKNKRKGLKELFK